MVLERNFESPLDSKEIKSVIFRIFRILNIHGITLNIFWKDWCWSSNTLATWCEELILGKDPDAGKTWGQEKKGMTVDEIAGWRHSLNGHEFEQTLGDGEGQGSLACSMPWSCKEWTWLSVWTTTFSLDAFIFFLSNCSDLDLYYYVE